ncbi:MAG: RDD family protein [Cognaticolwellia sp.]
MAITDDMNTNAGATKPTNTNKPTSLIARIKAKARNLSPEETREILTPFAFKIDQALFGISLAVPWRRGMALLIDLLLIGILSGAPGELLALLVAVTLFKIGGKKHAKKFGKKNSWRKAVLRFIGVFIVFIVLADTLPSLFSQMDEFNHNVEQAGKNQAQPNGANGAQDHVIEENVFIKGTLTVASALAISQSDCDKEQCWQQLTKDLFIGYAQQSSSQRDNEQFILTLVTGVEERNVLTDEQIEQLQAQLQQLNIAELAKQQQAKNETQATNIDSTDIEKLESNENSANSATQADELQDISPNSNANSNANSKSANNSTVYKGFAWLQGLIEDLGIGFGWAAFYFTMFTAIWHGQTPGKKLFAIRVIQLDGTPLSIWDSFGRYGGYGAGIATGLLGFAQIYWDPNRQAIHDKISATIVINDHNRHHKSTYESSDDTSDKSEIEPSADNQSAVGPTKARPKANKV